MEILDCVQLLLGGDDEGFIIGIESVSREPGYTVTSDLITTMTRAALDLRSDVASSTSRPPSCSSAANWLSMTCPILPGAPTSRTSCRRTPASGRARSLHREGAVYNAVVIEGDDRATGVIGKIDSFFAQTTHQCRRGRRGTATAMPRRLAQRSSSAG